MQGSELAVLKGGEETIPNASVIQIEAQFVPFYKQQPLYGELDIALRKAGFYLHKFTPLVSRVFKPLILENDIYAGLSQILWSDAIYIKKFNELDSLPYESLLKIAFITHEIYQSLDFCSYVLTIIDRQRGSQLQPEYLDWLKKE